MPNGSSSYYNSANLHHVFNQSQSNAQNYFNHTSNRGNGKLPRGQDAQPQLNHHRQQHQQVINLPLERFSLLWKFGNCDR